MRHITLLLAFWLLAATGAQAQEENEENRRLTISGQLLDSDQKEPMIQATVQLFLAADSAFVGGTVSDIKGNFSPRTARSSAERSATSRATSSSRPRRTAPTA